MWEALGAILVKTSMTRLRQLQIHFDYNSCRSMAGHLKKMLTIIHGLNAIGNLLIREANSGYTARSTQILGLNGVYLMHNESNNTFSQL